MGLCGLLGFRRDFLYLLGFILQGIGLVTQFIQHLFANGDFTFQGIHPVVDCPVFVITPRHKSIAHLRGQLLVLRFKPDNFLFLVGARITDLSQCSAYLFKRHSRTARCPLQVAKFIHQVHKTLPFGIKFLLHRIGLLDKLVLRIARLYCIYLGGQVIVRIFQVLNHLALNLDAFDHFLRGLVHNIATSNHGIGKALHAPQGLVNSRI